jgi:hypothetical protein
MISKVWYEILKNSRIVPEGTIIEIAPGFKSKIGLALAETEFKGEYHIIEPNISALEYSLEEYHKILPKATIYGHQKCLHEIEIGKEIPSKTDILLANHALDDMVLAMGTPWEQVELFFSMNSGSKRIERTKELWEAINQTELYQYANETVDKILSFLTKCNPQLTILSHYEGKTLTKHNINKPNEIGSYVAQKLQRILQSQIQEPYKSILEIAGYGLDWVIDDKRERKNIFIKSREQPKAIERLNQEIFVEESSRRLQDHEYEVVYTNNSLLQGVGLISTYNQNEIDKIIGKCFAYQLTKVNKPEQKIVYSDRQVDPTDIALSGNEGSGRACYIGSDFNIKGIGRTKLVKNPVDSLHGTGTLDLVTALREALISNFVYENTITKTSPVLAVLALKDKTKYVWNNQPIQNALLVRLDEGSLDRVSHSAGYPINRKIKLNQLIESYAKFDAEMFSRRIFHGAWSTGNSSLNGQWLDMESVSLVSGRGARFNITKKYISNYFGYESIGIKQVIDQLTNTLNPSLTRSGWEPHFNQVRKNQLTYETLRLLGVQAREIPCIIQKFPEIYHLSKEFEDLAKKISPRDANLNVFGNNFAGTHLLDFSKLFRNFPVLFQQKEDLLPCLIRSEELQYCSIEKYNPENAAERYLATYAVIEKENLEEFSTRTKLFLKSLKDLTEKLSENGNLPNQDMWEENAEKVNKNYPNFEQLTSTIKQNTELYQKQEMSTQELNKRLILTSNP